MAEPKAKFDIRDKILAALILGFSYILAEMRTDIKSLLNDVAIIKTEHLQTAKDIDELKKKVYGSVFHLPTLGKHEAIYSFKKQDEQE